MVLPSLYRGTQPQHSSDCCLERLVLQEATLKRKNLLSVESKFFLERVVPFGKGGNYNLVRLISIGGVSVLLKFCVQ